MQWMRSRFVRHVTGSVRFRRGLILVLAGLPAAMSSAQTLEPGKTARIGVERANFRATCSLGADVMATLIEGAQVEILERDGDWYQVRHLATGVEGCLHSTVLGSVPPSSEAEEDALREEEETREAAEREAAAREAAEREAAAREDAEREVAAREAAEREAEAREAELEAQREGREADLAARDADRTARRTGDKRLAGYLDFNVGYTVPAVDGLSYTSPVVQGSPPRSVPGSRAQSEYRYDRGPTFGVAGGFLVARPTGGAIGAGVSLTRATYSVDLDLEVSRPYPSLPAIVVADGVATRAPDREETVLHLHAVYALPGAERWQVRLFLGPSVFRSEVPVWRAVPARFPVDPPRMEIRRVEFTGHEETVVGGHAGADAAYFFSDVVGIGASAIYSRAPGEISIVFPDPADTLEGDFDLGGFSAMLGLRLRF